MTVFESIKKNGVFAPKVCGNECLFVPACDCLVSANRKHRLMILRNPIGSGQPTGAHGLVSANQKSD